MGKKALPESTIHFNFLLNPNVISVDRSNDFTGE